VSNVKKSSNISAGDWTPARRTEAAPSARTLLLTLLGEFVLPDGGLVWTATLVGALELLGVEEGAARQALARSSERGFVAAERVGRRTRWTLTPRAERLLREGAARIYSFGLEAGVWDGLWLLVLASVPEHNRHLRARLRTRMTWEGFGSLAPGAWVTPWADREAAAWAIFEDLDLTNGPVSWVGRPGAMGSVEERVGHIWDLDTVAAQYADFIAASRARSPASRAQAFAALARLVHDWRHFPAADPGLPAQLLPAAWPGQTAARTFHSQHDAWAAEAWQWWREHAER